MSATRCLLPLALGAAAIPAAAQDPAYLDDRSSAEAVVRSYANALERGEFLRAWSYHRADDHDPEAFRDMAEALTRVEVRTGEAMAEGAAGSLYWSLPIVWREERADGSGRVLQGCVVLYQTNPRLQEVPPFLPITIRSIDMQQTDLPFDAAEGQCRF